MLGLLSSLFKTSAELHLENLALRHQLGVLRRSAPKQLRLTPADRIFWVWLRRVWGDWKSVLMIVKPATVIAWHRKGFRLYWSWRVRRGKRGRPAVPQQGRDLIRMLSRNNPLWGAPRIHGEVLKLGIKPRQENNGSRNPRFLPGCRPNFLRDPAYHRLCFRQEDILLERVFG